MSEWQPIETAPRDGSDVITGAYDGDEWVIAVYHWESGPELNPGWTDGDGRSWGDEPTHWLQTPPPPVPAP